MLPCRAPRYKRKDVVGVGVASCCIAGSYDSSWPVRTIAISDWE